MRLSKLLGSAVLLASLVAGADQTLELKPSLVKIDKATICQETIDAKTPFKAPQELIGRLFPNEPLPHSAYMIYAAHYQTPIKGAKELVKQQEAWRMYSAEMLNRAAVLDLRRYKHYSEQRMYGMKDTAVLYCLGNIPASTISTPNEAWADSIRDRFGKEIVPLAVSTSPSAVRLAFALKKFTDLGADSVKEPEKDDAAAVAQRDSTLADAAKVFQTPIGAILKSLELAPVATDEEIKKAVPFYKIHAPPRDCSDACQQLWSAFDRFIQLRIAVDWKKFSAGQATDVFRFIDETTEAELKPTTVKDLYVTAAASPLLGLYFHIEVTRKTPTALEHLKQVVGLIPQSADLKSIKIKTEAVALGAGSRFPTEILPNTTDVKILAPKDDGDPTEFANQSYVNEARAHFDFGFAIPVKSQDDIEYNSDAGRLVSTTVDRAHVFGTVNNS